MLVYSASAFKLHETAELVAPVGALSSGGIFSSLTPTSEALGTPPSKGQIMSSALMGHVIMPERIAVYKIVTTY